jgi:hypothetical protein
MRKHPGKIERGEFFEPGDVYCVTSDMLVRLVVSNGRADRMKKSVLLTRVLFPSCDFKMTFARVYNPDMHTIICLASEIK